MAGNDNRPVSSRTTSFAGKHPELAGDTPATLRRAPSQRTAFDHARDPYISLQLKDMEKTEAQRRGESERSGRGSSMVKTDKPSPELRPTHEDMPVRETFNRAWLREQREARMAEYEQQRQEQHAIEQSRKSMEQEWEQKIQQHGPER